MIEKKRWIFQQLTYSSQIWLKGTTEIPKEFAGKKLLQKPPGFFLISPSWIQGNSAQQARDLKIGYGIPMYPIISWPSFSKINKLAILGLVFSQFLTNWHISMIHWLASLFLLVKSPYWPLNQPTKNHHVCPVIFTFAELLSLVNVAMENHTFF